MTYNPKQHKPKGRQKERKGDNVLLCGITY